MQKISYKKSLYFIKPIAVAKGLAKAKIISMTKKKEILTDIISSSDTLYPEGSIAVIFIIKGSLYKLSHYSSLSILILGISPDNVLD